MAFHSIYRREETPRLGTLALTGIVEEEEEKEIALLGGQRGEPNQELSMEGIEDDSYSRKMYDEDKLTVDIPETAHQISKGFVFVLLSLPFPSSV